MKSQELHMKKKNDQVNYLLFIKLLTNRRDPFLLGTPEFNNRTLVFSNLCTHLLVKLRTPRNSEGNFSVFENPDETRSSSF